MFELRPNDHVPLDDFPLRWRWTDSRWDKLSESLLKRIQPLTVDKSAEAWQLSMSFAGEGSDFQPNPDRFRLIEFLDEPHNSEAIDWLRSRMVEESQLILVNWDSSSSVLTDVALFCHHWDSFCYPDSDDVSVWPLDFAWVFHYWHVERFYFARRE